MRVDLKLGDSVAVTLDGDARTYGPGQAHVTRDETSTRGGDKARFLTIVIPLRDGEFPETTEHMG